MFIQVLSRIVMRNLLPFSELSSLLLCGAHAQQIRTTFILKRRWSPGLHKKNKCPRLRARHYIYDLVEDTTIRKHKEVDVLLTSYVEGLGNRGDRVAVRPNVAYNNLLLPGLGVYPTPENIGKYTFGSQDEEEERHSSPHAQKTANFLSRLILGVVMNKEMPWTLEPWHICMSFRKAGVRVAEKAITMPKYPIKGPDINLESKEFLIKVTINGMESALVRCRIHHWSTALADRLPWILHHWRQPVEPLFPEEAEIIKNLPEIPPPKTVSLKTSLSV